MNRVNNVTCQKLPQVALVFHGQSANNIFCATKHLIDSGGIKLGEYIDVADCIELMQS